ncbi:MAG: cobalamin-dependent protein [Planctomycetes bacterium]|nr:cobalamin-dependent protein [Planctomycetota bacterium]
MTADLRHAASMLDASARALAVRAVEHQLDDDADAVATLGFASELLGDTELRIHHLAAAVRVGCEELMFDQVDWLKVAMVARDLDWSHLDGNFRALAKTIAEQLPPDVVEFPVRFLERSRERLQTASTEIPSLLETDGPLIDVARRYLLAVLETRADDAVSLVLDRLRGGEAPETLLRDVLVLVQRELGRMWQMDEIHVAEEHYGSRVAERVMAAMHEIARRAPAVGKRLVTAAAGGELHELGLRTVSYHFEWAGWSTVLLGANMPIPDLIRAIFDFEPDLLALASSTPLQLDSTWQAIEAVRQYSDVPILVGGAPFTRLPRLAGIIGADASATDGPAAVAAGNRLVGLG